MARPLKNNADYFPHSASMRNEVKIKALRRHFKRWGYGIWQCLLEYLTESDFFRMEMDDLTIELVAADFDSDKEEFQIFIDYCIKIDLLKIIECNRKKYLSCPLLDESLSCLIENRKKERLKKQTTKVLSRENEIFQGENRDLPRGNKVFIKENTQSKVKESKVKNNTPLTPLGGDGDDNPVDNSGVVGFDNRGDSGLNESREKDSDESSTVAKVEEVIGNGNPKGYEKFDLSYIEEPFREAFFSWLEYKRADQSFKYKSDRSIKTCYNKLVELSGNDSHKAMLLVEQSIANGWKGFFLSTVSHGTGKQQLTAQQRIDAEIQRGIEHYNSIDETGGATLHNAVQEEVW